MRYTVFARTRTIRLRERRYTLRTNSDGRGGILMPLRDAASLLRATTPRALLPLL